MFWTLFALVVILLAFFLEVLIGSIVVEAFFDWRFFDVLKPFLVKPFVFDLVSLYQKRYLTNAVERSFAFSLSLPFSV